MKLTKATVGRLALPSGRAETIVFDEDLPGFGLRLRAGGSAVWVAQYRVGAKQRRATLGKLATLDPEIARRAAKQVLAKADLGEDHQAERRKRQAKAAVTFKAIADQYLAVVARAQKAKTHSERLRHLDRDWKPFHNRPLHEIERRDVAARLVLVAEAHGPIASNRARATLSAFYAWAIGHGLAETNPVVGTVKAGQERSRDRALTAEEIAAVWRNAGIGDYGCIVRLLLLTGQRRGEVAGMRWPEIDLGRGIWTLPAERSKNGLAHAVPLSGQAKTLLSGIERRGDRELLFGSAEGPFSGWGLPKRRVDARIARNRAAARLGRVLAIGEKPSPDDALPPWTLHDLRRTVVTGMNELGMAPHVVEAVVNHISGRARAGVAGVYNRATYATEKRMALQAWADHLDTVLGLGERTVVPMRA
jgi:integrase